MQKEFDYNNLFETFETKETPAFRQDISTEDYAAGKAKEREHLWALTNEALSDIIFSPQNFIGYLDVSAVFINSSINNKALIRRQMPTATALATYEEWQDLDAKVLKDEKAIKIWKYTKKGENSYVNPTPVFDISQTTAAEKNLPAKDSDINALIKAFAKESARYFGVNYELIGENNFEKLPAGYDSIFDGGNNTAYFKPLPDKGQMFKNLVKTTIKAQLQKNGTAEKSINLTAEAAAYVVCRHYGINAACSTDRMSFPTPQPAEDAKTALKPVKDALTAIDTAVHTVVKHIEINIKAMEAERSTGARRER